VDDLEAVRRTLGVRQWLFWGMSGGGWIGQLYAHRHPTALAGLILESVCACFRLRVADPACLLSPYNPAWREPLASAGLLVPGAHNDPDPVTDGEWTEVARVGSVFRRRGGPALVVSPMPLSPEMRDRMSTFWSVDTRSWLRQITTPTLVMCGDADPVVPIGHARALCAGIPQAEFVEIAGAGHVPVSQGRPEIAAAVRRFIGTRVLRQ
jgi:proline iminopeptidase